MLKISSGATSPLTCTWKRKVESSKFQTGVPTKNVVLRKGSAEIKPGSQQSNKNVPPKSRKPTPLFSVRPDPRPCEMAVSVDQNISTSFGWRKCNKPAHGNCLNDKLYCDTCYNSRMLAHKAQLHVLQEKRAEAKAQKQLSKPPDAKQPVLSPCFKK